MKNNIKKYDIWLVNLEPTKGGEQALIRPCLVFQSNIVSKYTTTYIVLPITSKEKRYGPVVTNIKKYKKVGLNQLSTILSFQIRTADKSRFIKKLGEITSNKLQAQIKQSLKISLDLDDEFINE